VVSVDRFDRECTCRTADGFRRLLVEVVYRRRGGGRKEYQKVTNGCLRCGCTWTEILLPGTVSPEIDHSVGNMAKIAAVRLAR
jgi:hypothetical protein